jgi:hypothetical protein
MLPAGQCNAGDKPRARLYAAFPIPVVDDKNGNSLRDVYDC